MTIVANEYAYVIGVDTHARTDTFVIVDTSTGAKHDVSTFPTSPAGVRRAVAWVGRRTSGQAQVLVVIEGIGSYGAAAARASADAGYRVVEPFPTARNQRRGCGKSDELDAELIARSVLHIDAARLREPRQDDGIRGALRVLVNARDQINRERTKAVNALTALLRTTGLGVDARRKLSKTQIVKITSWRAREEDIVTATARKEAIRLAKRITACDTELATNRQELLTLVTASQAAHLLDQPGIGPVNAAIILTAWSHKGRVRSEAAFAALSGTSPLPASSGNTTRHRLNRGGDRRLNRALASIALTRMAHHKDTRAYVERRRAEGRTSKEIKRTLKRYIARQLFRQLANPAAG